MKITRTHIIITAILFITIPILLAIIFTTNQSDQSEAYLEDAVEIRRDQDTGQLIEDDPNLAEQSVENRDVVILGMEGLVDAGLFGEQITFVKDHLNTYVSENLNSEYETVTIRPQDIKVKNGIYTTTVRLGETDTIVPFRLTATNTGRTQLIVGDAENGGEYNSGVTQFHAD